MILKNSDTSKKILVLMVDSTDHVTAKTGLTLTVTKSKNGGSFASWSGTSAEVANGVYALTPASGDVDTNGALAIHVTGSAADPADILGQVVAFDPYSADFGWGAATISHTPTEGTREAALASAHTLINKETWIGTSLKKYSYDDATVLKDQTTDVSAPASGAPTTRA